MARRSLSVHGLRFTKKYQRGAADEISPHLLDGRDLVDVFDRWCRDNIGTQIGRTGSNKVVRINSITPYADRARLVHLAVGSFGEEGPIINYVTGKDINAISEDEAPVAIVRALLLVPPVEARYAPFFTEYSIRGSGAGELFSSFAKYWSHDSDTVTMHRDQLGTGEDWIANSKLKEVGVSFYKESTDAFDPIEATSGVQYYALRAVRGESLGEKLYRKLWKEPTLASRLVGIRLPENATVTFKVTTTSGRTKTFEAGDTDDVLGYRETLNEHGQPALTDEEFVKRCSTVAREVLEPIGATWEEKWSTDKP